MFDIAVYTDVTSSESLNGAAGFNFMAKSAGITPVDLDNIEKALLHVMKDGWHLEYALPNGDWDIPGLLSHPESCRFAKLGDRYYLSRGRAAGLTITAPRPGNQLTQAIAASGYEDFIPYRPAQLFGAKQWDLTRPTGKDLEAWPTPLMIDESFEAGQLKADLVDNSPFGEGFLPAFLTMIEQAAARPAKKLIIVHTELELVMRYVALGTLFLDSRRALELSFAALVDNPTASIADIIGATPDFGDTPSALTSGPFNVVDLVSLQMSEIEVSGSAAQQARWFRQDPLNALAAIDIARRWEPALGPDVATATAAIASFTDRADELPPNACEMALRGISGLISGGLTDDLDLYAEELLGVVASGDLASPDIVSLAESAVAQSRSAGLDEISVGVLVPTLEMVASRPELIPSWASALAQQPIPAELAWDDADAKKYALVSQTEVINRARGEDLAVVLTATRSLDLLPEARDIAGALDDLASYWSANPDISQYKEALPFHGQLGARLTARLVERLDRGDDRVIEAISNGRWDWLTGRGTPLAGWHEIVRLSKLAPQQRSQAFRAAGRNLPPAGWSLALAGTDFGTHASLVADWIVAQPALDANFADWILQGVESCKSDLDSATQARLVIDALRHTGARTSVPALNHLIADSVELRRFFVGAVNEAARSSSPALLEFARRISGQRAVFFAAEIGELLVLAHDVRGVQMLERASGDWAVASIEQALTAMETHQGATASIQAALELHDSGTDLQRSAALNYVVALSDSRSGRGLINEARHQIDGSWLPVLDELLDGAKRGRVTRNLMRGGKRLLNKER